MFPCNLKEYCFTTYFVILYKKLWIIALNLSHFTKFLQLLVIYFPFLLKVFCHRLPIACNNMFSTMFVHTISSSMLTVYTGNIVCCQFPHYSNGNFYFLLALYHRFPVIVSVSSHSVRGFLSFSATDKLFDISIHRRISELQVKQINDKIVYEIIDKNAKSKPSKMNRKTKLGSNLKSKMHNGTMTRICGFSQFRFESSSIQL